MTLDLKRNALFSLGKACLQRLLFPSILLSVGRDNCNVVPMGMRAFEQGRISNLVFYLCLNTRVGKTALYLLEVRDFILRKISISSFLKKSVLFSGFIVGSYMGWILSAAFFPELFGIPPLVGSMLMGRLADRIVNWVLGLFSI